jgi:hypothetical protein
MITLLNGEQWNEQDILKKMDDDSFYYGHLGQHALSSSLLKPMLKSPKAFLKAKNESDDKQAYRDGRLIHLNILEEHKLNDLVIIEGTKSTKAYKEAVQEYGSSMVYTKSEYDNAFFTSKAIKNCDEAMELLEGCDFEVPAIGTIDGLPIRAKADAIKGKTIIDLKTTGDISKWTKSARWFDYNLQAALYLELFQADMFIFLVLDKDSKDIGIFDCSTEFIEEGYNKLNRAIANYKYWFKENPDPRTAINNFVIRDVI